MIKPTSNIGVCMMIMGALFLRGLTKHLNCIWGLLSFLAYILQYLLTIKKLFQIIYIITLNLKNVLH